MARLYTYAESPVPGLVRKPQDPRMAMGYVAGMPGVGAVVHARALVGLAAAQAVLAAHPSNQERTSNPEVHLVKGDRTDWHIEMTVQTDGDDEGALAAAFSIEYGRGGYVDSKGRRQKAAQGVGALRAAMAAMGGF